VGLMKSPRVLEGAVERVKALKPNLAYAPVMLSVAVSPKTTLFNLQAVGPEPEYTRAYLDACMEEFLNLKAELLKKPGEKTMESITEQLLAQEQDLKKFEEEEAAFKATNNVVF